MESNFYTILFKNKNEVLFRHFPLRNQNIEWNLELYASQALFYASRIKTKSGIKVILFMNQIGMIQSFTTGIKMKNHFYTLSLQELKYQLHMKRNISTLSLQEFKWWVIFRPFNLKYQNAKYKLIDTFIPFFFNYNNYMFIA